MNKKQLNHAYFNWMYDLVYDKRFCKRYSYVELLTYLHDIDFSYTIPMDSNRAEDGVDLRYRFGDEKGYSDAIIASYLDDKPCSVLEMMVALSVRCEEHIMDNPDIGNRTGQWFWGMITNLGLEGMTDGEYNEHYVGTVIDRLLDRQYDPDGKGGLFTVKNTDRDLRSIEIWYQLMWYLNEVG